MTKPTGDQVRKVFPTIGAWILFIAIVFLIWQIWHMASDLLSAPGPSDALTRKETVVTKIYVPVLQTLVTALFGIAFIKGALVLTANYFKAINNEPVNPIKFFSW
jgi:hypothetical protein